MKKEYKGLWYLPTKQEIKIPGVLSIDTSISFIELKLFSEINFIGEPVINEFIKEYILYPEIVLGQILGLTNGITLYSNFESGGCPVLKETIADRQFALRYKPTFAFIDKQFLTKEDIKFENISFCYTYLGAWFDASRIFFKRTFENEVLSITHRKIPDFDFGTYDNCKVTIQRNVVTKGEYSTEHIIKLRHFVNFKFGTEKPIIEFFKISEIFSTFLIFAIGVPVKLVEAHSIIDDNNSIEVYTSFMADSNTEKWINEAEMPIRTRYFDEIKLKEILKNWFNIYNNLQSVFDTYTHAVSQFWEIGSTELHNIEFSNGILNIAQSIERFFKRDDINYKKIRDEFTNRRNIIFGKISRNANQIGLSENDVDFINFNLKLSKNKEDYQFQNIVLYYLNINSDALKGLLAKSDFELFSTQVKECRNTLTHINHINSYDISNEFDLPKIFYYTQILFFAMTLSKIGLTQEEINLSLKRFRKFKCYFKKEGN